MNNKSALFIASLVSYAQAFWGMPHVLVARQAQAILEEKYPDVLTAALAEMLALQQVDPSLLKEKDHPFTECGTWADDVKGKGMRFQEYWHFHSQPYLDEPGTTLDDFSFHPLDVDVGGALTDLTKYLKNEITAEDSVYI